MPKLTEVSRSRSLGQGDLHRDCRMRFETDRAVIKFLSTDTLSVDGEEANADEHLDLLWEVMVCACAAG